MERLRQVGIPFYLVVDRDPRIAQTRLYSNPDQGAGVYLHEALWEFGETIRLPETFGLEIPTERWKPWK